MRVVFEAVLALPMEVPGLDDGSVEPIPYDFVVVVDAGVAFPAGAFSIVSTYPCKVVSVLLSSSM